MADIIKAPAVWARLSAGGGAIIWLALLAIALPDDATSAWIIRALALAMLVCVPLGLALIAPNARGDRASGLYRVAVWLQPVAALLGILAFWRTPGIGTAALAVPWFVCSAFIALYGGIRWLCGKRSAPETCLCVGMLLLAVGGGWLLLDRTGLAPAGYSSAFVLLIALHYHYAGFAAPLLTGLAGERLARVPVRRAVRQVFRAVAVGVCVGSPLVAIGAASTRLVEAIAVALLAASLMALALFVLGGIVPRTASRLGRALLIVSSGAVPLSMLLAVIYAVSNSVGHPLLTIAQMAGIHGAANAFGFVLCGLLAWSVSPALPAPLAPTA